jgi:hypothetical protein
MQKFWSEATFLLEILVAKTWNIDPNGVELMFTHGPVYIPGERKKKKDADEKKRVIETFKAAMKDSKAMPTPGSKTDMSMKLRKILYQWIEDYKDSRKFKRKKSDLTVLVLTDGKWTGMERKPLAVDQTIKEFHDELKKTIGDFRPERQVSISFISFGHDSDAIYRLQRLDNDLGEEGVP